MRGRVYRELKRTQLDIAARFRRGPEADCPHAAQACTDAAALKSTIRRMKLGQLARAKRPPEEVEIVTPREFSFERLHPALADAHHLRTKAENERLQQAAEQAAQRSYLCTQRTPRKTRAGGSSSRGPPPLQLPDWDRVVSPDKLRPGSAGQAWRPVSPTGKRVAPPDSPSPHTKRQHETEVLGDRATMAPADAAAREERELQAGVAAFERSLQTIESGGSAEARAKDGEELGMSEQEGSELYEGGVPEALDSDRYAASCHSAADSHRDWRRSNQEEQEQHECMTAQRSDEGASQPHAEPVQPRHSPAPVLAEWWHDGGNGTADAAAVAVLQAWLCDYYCEADDAEASARCLALLEASAERNAAREAPAAGQQGSLRRAQEAARDRRVAPAERRTSSSRQEGVRAGGGRAPKESIRARRLREDMERRATEEAAELAYSFHANPLPRSTTEPRYSLIRTQQAQRLAEARAQHQRTLQDAEYSFAKRDRATAAARAAAAAEAQRMLRAQQGFRAHPVPQYIRKEAEEHRRRREVAQGREADAAARQAAGQSRAGWDKAARWQGADKNAAGTEENSSAAANSPQQQQQRKRQVQGPRRTGVSKRLYRSPNPRHASGPEPINRDLHVEDLQHAAEPFDGQASQQQGGATGEARHDRAKAMPRARQVPNFAALHAAWARRLAAARAAVGQALTVPHAFRLTSRKRKAAAHEGDTNAEAHTTLVRRARSESAAGRWRPLEGAPDLAQRASSQSERELSRLDALSGRAVWRAQLLAQKIARIREGCISICLELGLPCPYLDAPCS